MSNVAARADRRARRPRLLTAALALGCLLAPGLSAAARPAYDIVIVNGRVIDPESGLDETRTVAIKEGKIARVTTKPLKGARTIDARGLVVAPGFIDLHAHAQDPFAQRLHAQDGVTTALELESGVLPIEPWYRRRIGAASINFGASVSHAAARAVAFEAADPTTLTGEPDEDFARLRGGDGWRLAATTPAQRKRMSDLIARELNAGGIGIGYHISTTPGADTAELTEFFGLAAKHRGPNMIHFRSVGQVAPTKAAEEMVAVGKATGAAIHVVHVNSSGLWETKNVLATLDAGRRAGVDVTTEVYPYTGAHSSFDDPRSGPEGMASFRATYSDVEFIATGERLTEKTFAEYKQRYPKGDLIVHIMRQADVDMAVEHPGVMIASDGIAYIDGKSHPRGAGTFSRIFSRYVRERKSLTLSEAIAKVSYLPAKRLEPFAPEMRLRGRVRQGAVADLTLFDPEKIADRATYADGAAPSVGIAYVLVAGQPVVDDHQFRPDVKPGQPIYGHGKR